MSSSMLNKINEEGESLAHSSGTSRSKKPRGHPHGSVETGVGLHRNNLMDTESNKPHSPRNIMESIGRKDSCKEIKDLAIDDISSNKSK